MDRQIPEQSLMHAFQDLRKQYVTTIIEPVAQELVKQIQDKCIADILTLEKTLRAYWRASDWTRISAKADFVERMSQYGQCCDSVISTLCEDTIDAIFRIYTNKPVWLENAIRSPV